MNEIFIIKKLKNCLNFAGSEKQKAGTEKVLRFLIEKKPNSWSELQKKYDPENIYYTKYKKEAEARGIKV
jgi:Insect pheromone-binding family, A10/OS-D